MKNILDKQRECCEFYDKEFNPVNLNQLVVVSKGVLTSNSAVEGVRYKSPTHMSGWWLTTDQYDGDFNTLENVHFSHIIHKRPDLAIYMALPYGYRFILGTEKEYVWLDEALSHE
ncbi:hypothetical protein [Acinetobacter sp. YH12023]|uniref:immunity protein Imm33 domain-containing protein n=1 Tax=Acinetobacter sp. YH12023 TaxID=2601041 RepID=UPI0015D3B612|nr:hypothetical protein [Acinetobacter sp. YH12023]